VRIGYPVGRLGRADDSARRVAAGARRRDGEHDAGAARAAGARAGFALGEGKLEDSLMVALLDTHCGLYMAQTSDKLARRHAITREQMDAYALRSQRAAADAERAACSATRSSRSTSRRDARA
jgi:acetyl-CoA acetyltransferase